MAISSSGFYGLTLEKMFIDTAGESMEAEDNKALLVVDAYTPDFTAHDFRNDVTDEVPNGGGYTTGGQAFTATEITLASGILTWDFADVAWASSTIANAMAMITYFNVGSAATDQLLLLLDFVTAVSTTNGTLTVQINASGAMTVDFVP